jgi:hypothetical protein
MKLFGAACCLLLRDNRNIATSDDREMEMRLTIGWNRGLYRRMGNQSKAWELHPVKGVEFEAA